MYESFFHLKARPFVAAPLVHQYFAAESIERARQTAIRVVERAEGPVLVLGPAGIGKSLLCRMIADYFANRFRVALLAHAQMGTRKALLQNILFELRQPYREMDEGELRLSLIEYVQSDEACPQGVLLIIDEAHSLSARLLEELRMVQNLVHAGQPRVRMVLAGGPRLDERFASPKLEVFNQRVAARCYLQPFRWEETQAYMRAQITHAGGKPDEVFSEDACQAVHRASEGIPRLVNQVCNHALTLACSSGHRKLEGANIEEAWADLQQLPSPWQESRVEAARGKAVIEFGELDAGVSMPTGPDGDVSFTDQESNSQDEAWQSLTHSLTTLEFGEAAEGAGGESTGALGDASPAVPEPEAEVAPPCAEDPFEVPFDEEEVVADPWAERLAGGTSQPVRLAVVREDAAESGPPAADGLPRPHYAAELARAPSPDSVVACSVFETMPTAEVVYDTSGIVPIPSLKWGPAEDDASVQCVTVPMRKPAPADDRDLLEVDAAEVSAGTGDMPEPRPGQARRVEYRELFAQLRQAD